MSRPGFALVALFAGFPATAGCRAVDKINLRQAACLPVLCACRCFCFSGMNGFSLEWKDTPLPERIATLRKLLKTDPANAEVYIRLGALYAKAGNGDESKEVYTKAAALCRRQLEHHPNDISWRLTLTEALRGLEQDDEAELLLRQAVKDAPENWQCWLELAEALASKSLQTIMGKKTWYYNSPETLLQIMREARPTEERFSASQPYRKEAAACFDKAIALAPREPKIYRRRAMYRKLYKDIDCGFRMLKGEKVNPAEILLPPPDALEDWRRFADLSGDDYEAIGTITSMEAIANVFEYQSQHPASKPPAKPTDMLSEVTRKRVAENLKRLENGMRDPDKHKAATAAVILGTLQVMLKDEQAAEKSFRRCLELDPGRDDAWDMLTAMLATANRYSEVLELSLRRVKHKDSAHNRMWLAKAYEYLHQLDKAEGEIWAGLKLAPDDFLLNLALADLHLMRGQDDDLQRAGELLCKAGKNPHPGTPNENRWINYSYACGIYYGLIGDVKQARQCLEAVQRLDPENLLIKEALRALDESAAENGSFGKP